MSSPFEQEANIEENSGLRIPQREGFSRLRDHFGRAGAEREVSQVIPVGCGKSLLIGLAPFAVEARRTLVVAPYVKIAEQLYEDYDPANFSKYAYTLRGILVEEPFPEAVEIRGRTTNRADLEAADLVITNIDQLGGQENRWLNSLPPDFFDLIVFDEGHHAVAATWENLKGAFPDAKILNLSATPRRADGQVMPGKLIYSFSVREGIEHGYNKRLKAQVLNPSSLRYVRQEDGQEIEVSLEEVRKLGEEDATFRRSIVTSKETLDTVVDASLRELQRIRAESGDPRHKIIAAALNHQHCVQVTRAYRERGQRVAFVHSRENCKANQAVLDKLARHELDVIVQVRKLSEGFDHRHLSVAAVFSVFANLSPFVQFVGRIMRTLNEEKGHPSNQGTVIFHAGANVAQRWEDFREFSDADQDYFAQLLPLEQVASDGEGADLIEVNPTTTSFVAVRGQDQVSVQVLPLIEDDPEALAALQVLHGRGYTLEDIGRAFPHKPISTSKVARRKASRAALREQAEQAAGRLLRKHELNPRGHELDFRRDNYITVKAAIDRALAKVAGRSLNSRDEFTQADLDKCEAQFDEILAKVEEEVICARA